jgi:hypothetical protein
LRRLRIGNVVRDRGTFVIHNEVTRSSLIKLIPVMTLALSSASAGAATVTDGGVHGEHDIRS